MPARRDVPAARSDVAQALSTVLTLLLQDRTLSPADVDSLSWDQPVLVLRSAHMGRLQAFVQEVCALRPAPQLHIMSHARDEHAIRAMTDVPLAFHPYPTPGPYCLEEVPPGMLADLRGIGFGMLVFLDAGNTADGLEQVQRLLAGIGEARMVAYRADGTFARAEDWRRRRLATVAFQRLVEWYHLKLDPVVTEEPALNAGAIARPPRGPTGALAVNLYPAMTKYIVDSGVLRDDPVTIVDVGGGGGCRAEWRVFGDSLRVICFEFDEDECARLAAGAPPNVTYIPAALGNQHGEATLYVTQLEASSGLYCTDMRYFRRFLNADNANVIREEQVNLVTLDDTLARVGSPAVDFIKVDAEGAELDILQGAPRMMSGHSLLGVLSEFRLHPEINGCPTFSDLDRHLQSFGFRVFDMYLSHQSRRALPYPVVSDYRRPGGKRFFANTTHGQVMDGDALFFRDLLIAPNAEMRSSARPHQILKAAALFEIYCLNDCAAELLIANEARLRGLLNCRELLHRLVPRVSAASVGFEEYVASYFDPERAIVGE